MPKLILAKVRAFTILETMVALTIALLMFGMMSSLFIQISRKSYSSRKLKAHELLNSFVISMSQNDSFYNSKMNIDGYLIKTRFTKVDSFPLLFKSKFEIYDDKGQLLDQVNKFIISQKSEDENQ